MPTIKQAKNNILFFIINQILSFFTKENCFSLQKINFIFSHCIKPPTNEKIWGPCTSPGADIMFIALLAAKINPWACLMIATSRNWLGGLVIYYISYSGKPEKIKRFLKLPPEQLEKQKKKINRYGTLMALFVWIPLIGDVSNVALGFYRIKPPPLFLMFIGHMIRFLLWIILYLIFANNLISF